MDYKEIFFVNTLFHFFFDLCYRLNLWCVLFLQRPKIDVDHVVIVNV